MQRFSFVALALLAIAFLFYLKFGSNQEKGFEKQSVQSAGAPKPIGPYSQAIRVGNTLFVSGQIALNAESNEMDTADIATETKRVMKNIVAILDSAKMNTENIVKSTIYLTDLNNFKSVNEIYGSYFTGTAPARETVEVKALPKGAHIEISVIAVK